VLQWKRKFGWIEPDESLDHPEAFKNNWRIYVNVLDVSSGVLYSGARVSFFVYSDGKGLGAEDVQLEGKKNVMSGKGAWAPRGQIPTKFHIQRSINKEGNLRLSTLRGGKKGGKAKGKGMQPRQMGADSTFVCTTPQGPDRQKQTESGDSSVLSWASSEMRGWRPAMEDATCVHTQLEDPLENYALFGVFDGHGGSVVSRYAARELPKRFQACAREPMLDAQDTANFPGTILSTALVTLDEALRRDGEGEPGFLHVAGGGKPIESSVRNSFGLMGSTAIVALVECDGPPETSTPLRVTVANLGDSRAVICRGGEAVPLSEDHKPDLPSERARIEEAGGSVGVVGPCARIDGWGLNLSRALGDFHYKAREDLAASQQKVSSMPDINILQVTPEDEFLFLGCDGIFELNSNQDVVDKIRAGLHQGRSLEEIVEDLVDASCSTDLVETGGLGGDNVTAMVILLQPDEGALGR